MAKSKSKRSSRKLRLAFIGAGGIAGAHLKALSKFDDVEVVALADVVKDTLKQRSEEYGIPSDALFTDYQEMLKQVQPDAVSICTPNGLHAENAIAASQAGAHVLVEKPMAMNAKQCQEMIAAADKAGKKLVIGFQYRHDAKTDFLVRQRDSGLLGELLYGRVQALRRRGIPNWGVFGRKELQGGGPLIDIGVHVLEMCHYTMGSPKPVAAVGMTSTYLGNKPSNKIASRWAGWNHKTYTVEDLAVGHIRFDNGAVIHIEASFAAHHEHSGKMDFQVMGTKGGAIWESSQVFTDHNGYMTNIEPAWLPTSGGFGGSPNFFGDPEGMVGAVLHPLIQIRQLADLENRDFVDHVLHDKPTKNPAEAGLMVQQMLDAIYQSADNGGKEAVIK